jgi:hypothetical protein
MPARYRHGTFIAFHRRRDPAGPGRAACHTEMSVRALTVAYMDSSPVVSIEALWPELPEQRRPFEVMLTAPREDRDEPLVPRALPPEVLGCWSADQVTVSATVLAPRPSAAVAAVEALVPELAGAAGVDVTVRAAEKAPAGPAADAATGS